MVRLLMYVEWCVYKKLYAIFLNGRQDLKFKYSQALKDVF